MYLWRRVVRQGRKSHEGDASVKFGRMATQAWNDRKRFECDLNFEYTRESAYVNTAAYLGSDTICAYVQSSCLYNLCLVYSTRRLLLREKWTMTNKYHSLLFQKQAKRRSQRSPNYFIRHEPITNNNYESLFHFKLQYLLESGNEK